MGPFTYVLHGASGDLASRMILPALLELEAAGALHERTRVVGLARRDWDDDAFREQAARELPQADGALLRRLLARLHFAPGRSDRVDDMRGLGRRLEALEQGLPTPRVHHLAIPPGVFEAAVAALRGAGLVPRGQEGAFDRVLVEKPFGRDLDSARSLWACLEREVGARQVLLADHFLALEASLNLLVLRFGNGLLEPLWNRHHIDHVELTVAEALGLEGRGRFYEGTGVVRDMVQNHLLQIVALLAMEAPASLDAEGLGAARARVLGAVRPVSPERRVLGQYRGYRDEPDVDPRSEVPTYAALELRIDDWRWQGVPFYLRTGKRMAAHAWEVVVAFRPAPEPLLGLPEDAGVRLRLTLDPEARLGLSFLVKAPGGGLDLRRVAGELAPTQALGGAARSPYARMIEAAVGDDRKVFADWESVERAWRIVAPLLEPGAPEIYEPGSEGPASAQGLLAPGHRWSPLEG